MNKKEKLDEKIKIMKKLINVSNKEDKIKEIQEQYKETLDKRLSNNKWS